MRTILLTTTLTLALTLGVLTGAANASSVTVSGDTMTITAKPGEENEVEYGAAGSDERGPLVRVIDGGTEDIQPNTSNDPRIVAGGTCNQSSNGEDAFCPTTGVTRIVVDLGDLNDEYDGSPLDIDTTLTLGAGNDTAETEDGNDTINGGPGDDTINPGGTRSGSTSLNQVTGDAGDDTFDLRGGDADDVSGGADDDIASYTGHGNGVTITIDDQPNDGRSSEDDNIRSDIEHVIGSNGNDTLNGNSSANILEGALGVDTFAGNGGPDTYRLRDGVRDNFFCFDSDDTIDRDLVDPLLLHCAFLNANPVVNLNLIRIRLTAFVGAVREGPNLRITSTSLKIARNGDVPVKLACPAGLRRGCNGRVDLREATQEGRRLARVRYRLEAGKRTTVRPRLTDAERERVLETKVIAVEAVERGDHGLKTTYALRGIR